MPGAPPREHLIVRASDLFEVVVRSSGFFVVLFGVLRLLFLAPYLIRPPFNLGHGDIPFPDCHSEALMAVILSVLGLAPLFC